MTVVSVVYASRHGATAGIAERIAAALRADGLNASARPAEAPIDLNAEAFVIGSAVYIGAWLKEAREFVSQNAPLISQRPVWLFSSGPLGPATAEAGAGEAVNAGVIQELTDEVHPREHHVFAGAYDPTDPPKAVSERLVRLMPTSKDLLPAGDFRDWPAIDGWAHGIAAELASEPVTV
jgi:menaquinone-dependent protoporphyrinogen oxidase